MDAATTTDTLPPVATPTLDDDLTAASEEFLRDVCRMDMTRPPLDRDPAKVRARLVAIEAAQPGGADGPRVPAMYDRAIGPRSAADAGDMERLERVHGEVKRHLEPELAPVGRIAVALLLTGWLTGEQTAGVLRTLAVSDDES